ncbi:MAG: hypothetical protein QE272_04980 [Nevskia sp.]|nr:hypothetical protein [Nevskia sp.]
MSARLISIAVAGSGQPISAVLENRALEVGRLVAEIGCNLVTGGGRGIMLSVAEGFCKTPDRIGRSIGILPGSLKGNLSGLGETKTLVIAIKHGYPNDWVEIPIPTHLPGQDPKALTSRNYLNAAAAQALIALPGGQGTQAELEIAVSLGIPAIAWLQNSESIGSYMRETLPSDVIAVGTLKELTETLKRRLLMPPATV